MSEAVIRSQLLEKFGELENDEKLLSECISICRDYNVSGETFCWVWESLTFGRNFKAKLFSAADAESVKKKLINDLNTKRDKERRLQAREQRRAMAMSKLMPVIPGSTAKPSVSHIPSAQVKSDENYRSSVSFRISADGSDNRKYRYMYEKISERSAILDDQIDELAELVREHYDIDDLGDPSSTSQEDVVVVGRICNNGDASEASSKLTEESVFLESSRMMGSGSRIRLRFSANLKLKGAPQGSSSVSLFPGAIVALRGRNGGGGFFVVEELLSLPPLVLSSESAMHRAFTMVMACGPYTPDADLDYKHFSILMESLRSSPPSVLLLFGPFIDTSHPSIKSGDADKMPSELFRIHFVKQLQELVAKSPDTLVLIAPSIRDILSDHPVYPQSQLDIPSLANPRIRMLPSPCRFSINDVSFGITSVDVLFHLRNQEYVQRGAVVDPAPPISPESSSNDIFTNSCRQLLSQRSFYPLFPVPQDMSSEVNLDVTHSGSLRLDSNVDRHAPDILILPSRLKQFTKVVDGTWAINPSFLTKGSYARISVPDTVRGSLRNAMKCEIVKL